MKHRRAPFWAGLVLACLCLGATIVSAEETLVNINTASVAELSALKGIGEVKAQDIIAHREKNGPFKSVDDLRQVNGIGEKLLAKLRPHVTVGTPAAAAAPAAKR